MLYQTTDLGKKKGKKVGPFLIVVIAFLNLITTFLIKGTCFIFPVLNTRSIHRMSCVCFSPSGFVRLSEDV